MMQNKKIGRNDPCLCGSGLKYKKCCLRSKQIEAGDFRLRSLQAELKQKIRVSTDQEMVFLEPNSQSIKMSEVILEFVEDILKYADSRSEKKKVINLACLAWNLAFFKEKSDEEYETQLDNFLNRMGIKNQVDRSEIELLINALVDKKINEYPTINRFIVNHQIDFARDELTLNVASMLAPAEIAALAEANEN